jgi:hypothetical protein
MMCLLLSRGLSISKIAMPDYIAGTKARPQITRESFKHFKNVDGPESLLSSRHLTTRFPFIGLPSANSPAC